MPDDPSAPDPLLDPPAWAPTWLPSVDDLRGMRVLRWVVLGVLVAGLASCMSRGADSPPDPVLAPERTPVDEPPDDDAAEELAAAFGTALAELRSAAGDVVELCLLLADTAEERGRGLMEVEDLGRFDGMAFAHEAPVDSPFFMYRTVLPLTVAWWDDAGAFVGATDMAPCAEADPAACPRHPPPAPYRLALEVPQGSPLAATFAPGASLRLTGAACPAVPS